MREGDVFGEISLLLGKPVSATVSAEEGSVVLRLEREAFERLILSQPGMRRSADAGGHGAAAADGEAALGTRSRTTTICASEPRVPAPGAGQREGSSSQGSYPSATGCSRSQSWQRRMRSAAPGSPMLSSSWR